MNDWRTGDTGKSPGLSRGLALYPGLGAGSSPEMAPVANRALCVCPIQGVRKSSFIYRLPYPRLMRRVAKQVASLGTVPMEYTESLLEPPNHFPSYQTIFRVTN